MNQERREFLSLSTLPARMGIAETSWFLGFSQHDITTLIAAGLLKPLGRPAVSGSKYFATNELQTLRSDARWLAKASDAVVNYWKSKNSTRKKKDTHQPHLRADGF